MSHWNRDGTMQVFMDAKFHLENAENRLTSTVSESFTMWLGTY